jgi:hypothetical protein
MCMAAAGLLGAVVQLGGSMMSAAGAQAEGAKAKQISDANALRLEKQGRYQARQIRRKASYVNGAATAQAAANGMAISGSALDIIMDSAVQGEIDASNAIRNNNDNAHIQRLEGEAAVQRANNAAMSHIIGGFSGFLKVA